MPMSELCSQTDSADWEVLPLKVAGELTAENILAIQLFGSNNEITRIVPRNLPEKIELNVEDPIHPFFGREEMTVLREALKENTHCDDNHKITVVSQASEYGGMGGVGKSEAMRKYVQMCKMEYGHVVWINAISHFLISSSFNQLAALCAITTADEFTGKPKPEGYVREEVYDFLFKKRCLIVFDGAESLSNFSNQEGISSFLPGTIRSYAVRPTVVITSRKMLCRDAVVVQLSGLSFEECFDWLKCELQFENTEGSLKDATQIMELCKGLTLAIHQIIAFIRSANGRCDPHSQTRYTMRNFLTEYLECDLLEHNTGVKVQNFIEDLLSVV